MKKTKGFTLIELMIVVAIIGILAAIAIPNFLRYQLRTKASERRINLEAIFKAEEALRQSERQVTTTAAPGQYWNVAQVPANALCPRGAKTPWTQTDIANAQQIDWIVQGSTYGCYRVNSSVVSAQNVAISACGWTDIDADGLRAGDALWQPQLYANGAVRTVPPLAPCGTNVNNQIHGFAYVHGTSPMGRPQQLSADSVF